MTEAVGKTFTYATQEGVSAWSKKSSRRYSPKAPPSGRHATLPIGESPKVSVRTVSLAYVQTREAVEAFAVAEAHWKSQGITQLAPTLFHRP